MSPNLRDLLHELADHETAGAAAAAPDTRTEVQMLTREIHGRRSRRVAAVASGAAAAVVAGVLVASGVVGSPRPVPASPEPSATTSARPTPETSPEPSAIVEPEQVDPGPLVGLVPSLAQAPEERWTVSVADLVPGWSSEEAPRLGDVTRGSILPGVRTIDAGDVQVALVADWSGLEQHLVGIDAATGDVRWSRPTSAVDGYRVWTCAGVSPDGLVVCHGLDESSGATGSGVALLDPATGTVVRMLPLSRGAGTLGVTGGVVLAHGPMTAETVLGVEAIDLATGAPVWSRELAGVVAVEEFAGEVAIGETRIEGDLVLLTGAGYAVTVDLRTGDPAPTTPTGTPDVHGPVPWGHDVRSVGPGVVPPALVPRVEGRGTDARALGVRALRPDGSELWAHDAPGAVVSGLVGDGVVVGQDDGLALLDGATGATRWTVGAGDVLAFDGTRLLVSQADAVEAVEVSDGSIVWSMPTSGSCTATVWPGAPTSVPGTILCGSGDALSLFR
ncbi:PQQ-binding-like beta-propeller repeat protein [Cellulomonas sp. 179-A 4D5 NHS]|uniref:outer membrane protein assembly factor BamB family protein n=1 Tax=Cellulomonas sp. 179-A 4D5 NHS TaxID=3142378 RepID=UPI0039A138E2